MKAKLLSAICISSSVSVYVQTTVASKTTGEV